jgi:DNA-binding XRE family transcriptional regulator
VSQQKLAKAIGRHPTAVTQWETDKYTPRRRTAQAIDEALEAGGAVLAIFGYTNEADFADRLVALEEQLSQLAGEAEALRRVLDLAVKVDQLAAVVALQGAELERLRRQVRPAEG